MITVCRSLRMHIALSTKSDNIGRQLDVYARRDPQLVPYLLRQVDTEFQRGCNKIKYIFWVGIFVAASLYDIRIECELTYFLLPYLEQLRKCKEYEIRDYQERQAHAKYLLELLERLRSDPNVIHAVRKEVQEKIKKSNAHVEKVGYIER